MRSRRRLIIVGVIVFAALVEAGVAVAIFAGGKSKPEAPTLALPMHPVAGAFKPNATKLAECSSSDEKCVEQAFGNIAYYRGPKAVRPIFDRTYGNGANPACHRVAHIIGAASLARFHGNVAKTFASGWADCWSGYYHGVLERALVTNGGGYDRHSLVQVARRLCADRKVLSSTWLAYQCLHGLGHGLMIATGYDLPLALKVCGGLQSYWDDEACWGGTFMENFFSSYGFTSRYLKDDDLVYPCDSVSKQQKLPCYQLVTSHVLRVVGLDWKKVAQTCASVEKSFRSACFQSYGRDVSGQTQRNPDEIQSLCAIARPYGGERDCITFAAMDITANFTDGKPAAALCNTTEGALRDACYRAVGTIEGRFKSSDAARAADCRRVSPVARDVAACIAGATGKQPAGVVATR